MRENYIWYHCRHLEGFDFEKLETELKRNGAWEATLPVICGKIKAKNEFLVKDWQFAQQKTKLPVKVTIPGPLTIADTTVNKFYQFCDVFLINSNHQT